MHMSQYRKFGLNFKKTLEKKATGGPPLNQNI